MTDFRKLWAEALPYHEFIAGSEHRALWDGIYRVARLPAWAPTALPAGSCFKLLVITEDWCGDGANTVPVIARWVDSSSGVELKLLRRDEHPDLMNRYLTNGARAIPIVIVLDENFNELGHWGPRPRELQDWVASHRHTIPKAELYPLVRRWYARDRGETTICELLTLMGQMCGRAA